MVTRHARPPGSSRSLVLALELPAQGRAMRLDVLHGKAGDEGDALPGALEPPGQGGQGQHPEGGAVHPLAAAVRRSDDARAGGPARPRRSSARPP